MPRATLTHLKLDSEYLKLMAKGEATLKPCVFNYSINDGDYGIHIMVPSAIIYLKHVIKDA